jgi:hypothetical protein
MEGSLAMVDAEAVDDDAPVLGARRTLADIVNIVVNKLGFSIDGAEKICGRFIDRAFDD